MISYALWQGQFGGRADIVGQTVPGSARRVPIVGVTPPAFFGVEVGRQFGVAMPICASGNKRRDHWWLRRIGRLKPGWTRRRRKRISRASFPTCSAKRCRTTAPSGRPTTSRWRAERRRASAGRVAAAPVVSAAAVDPDGDRRPRAADGASVNLANLLLARATARQQEFAVRLAIGGTRGRVLQQVLTESLLLAAIGSIAAVGVALAVSRSIPPLDQHGGRSGFIWTSRSTGACFGFTALVGVADGADLRPRAGVRLARTSIRFAASAVSAGNEGSRIRRALVAAQIAVTLVLLFGGLLFLRTFRNLDDAGPGVRERGVVGGQRVLPRRGVSAEKRADAYRDLDERLRAMPGVIERGRDVHDAARRIFLRYRHRGRRQERGESNVNRVGPGLFRTRWARRSSPAAMSTTRDTRRARGWRSSPGVRRGVSQRRRRRPQFTVPDDRGRPANGYEVIGVIANQKYMDIRERSRRSCSRLGAGEAAGTDRGAM